MDNIIKLDTLVVTATLGFRNSLDKTISSVKKYGGNRVKHILTCPDKELKNLQKKYPEMEIIPEPKDKKGIYFALNNAIKKYAKEYKYVTYINDDDYWLLGFKELFKVMDDYPKTDLVYGRTLFVSENNEKIREQASSPRWKYFKNLLKYDIVLFTQQATLIKSDLFYKIGGYDESYELVADTKFWVEAIEYGADLTYKNTLAAAYTLQEGQLSSDKTTQEREKTRLLNEDMFQSVNQMRSLYEKFLFRLNNTRVYLDKYLK